MKRGIADCEKKLDFFTDMDYTKNSNYYFYQT